MSQQLDSRSQSSLSSATRIALMVAAGFLAVAAYFYLSPTSFMGKDGGLFGCGSPMSPNGGSLGKGQCRIVESGAAHKAYLFLALAVITAALGYVLFNSAARGGAARIEDDWERNERDDRGELRSSRRAARRDDDVARDVPTSRRARLGDEDDPGRD